MQSNTDMALSAAAGATESATISATNSEIDSAIEEAAVAASGKIAPLWPLKHFVAVNPLLGLAANGLNDAGLEMARASGARLTMPRAYYADHLATNKILDVDLVGAIEELAGQLPGGTTAAKVRSEALRPSTPHNQFQLASFAKLAERSTGTTWEAFLINNISQWASGFFDEGVAPWAGGHESLDPWLSYRSAACIDRSAELLGLPGARSAFASLPDDPKVLLREVAVTMGIAPELLSTYFHRLLCDIAGWAGYARYLGWIEELRGESFSGARSLLAVRAAWELVLFKGLQDVQLRADWNTSLLQYAKDDQLQWQEARGVDHVMQLAFERAEQRQLAQRLLQASASETPARPAVQAAFCIDVRSERYRRALEAQSPDIETIGFAGFFGMPVGYSDDSGATTARCPVLLEPPFQATKEASPQSDPFGLDTKTEAALNSRWSRFQRSAVSNFGFVEALGLTYLPKLLKAVKGVDHQHTATCSDAKPSLELELAEQVALAEGLLRGMSLTENFAPIVLLAGHGSTSRNNPYASALDCGACGGHAGDVNARLAVQLLNKESVRAELVTQGITIPNDTVFVAGLHDTTTDDVTLYEADTKYTSLIDTLKQASALARTERAASLREEPANIELGVRQRAGDWSQVRPEWGLAGCNAFIAAPRSRTRDFSLSGRSFLHNYNADNDEGFNVLESILTAPLVVASWITLQYYGSTVDNAHFGSGDKTLHNIVAGIGVLEGSAGDLRSGLPMQSLHDGQAFVHEPMRLTAVIEAPREAVNEIIEKHSSLRELVDNHWIQMHVLDANGLLWRRQPGGADWIAVGGHSVVDASARAA